MLAPLDFLYNVPHSVFSDKRKMTTEEEQVDLGTRLLHGGSLIPNNSIALGLK